MTSLSTAFSWLSAFKSFRGRDYLLLLNPGGAKIMPEAERLGGVGLSEAFLKPSQGQGCNTLPANVTEKLRFRTM